jgi:protein O-mannosyl-transferase
MSRVAKLRREARAAEASAALKPAERATWRRWSPLVAALLAFAVYAPSLRGGFLYDDHTVVVMNPYIRDLGAIGTVLRYEPSRPLLNLTWALNYAAGGLEPWSYHLVNVLLHAGSAALLVSLFTWMARRRQWSDPEAGALAGACLFAVTPMATETVAYVSSRSTALVTLFALASLRLGVQALTGRAARALAASMVFYLLALGTKEEAASIPFLLLLLDYFFVAGQRAVDMKRRLWIHGAFLIFLPLGLFARWMVTGAWLPAPFMDRSLYLLTQSAAFGAYLLRAVLPLDPAFYRYHLPASWPPGAWTVAGLLFTAAVVFAVVRDRRTRPEWSFAVACLAAGLLPSSSFVPLNEMVVDHRAYLGSAGVLFALGGLLWKLGGARLVALVVVLLAGRTVHYEWILADPVRAWEDAVRRAPGSPDAASALGESYAARQDPRAETEFRRAVELNPGHFRHWAALGVYYSENQRIAEAEPALREAARLAPHDATLRDYHAVLLQSLGRDDEAVAQYEAAIAAEPQFVQARINLAGLWLRRGDTERARALLAEASKLPTEPEEAAAIVRLQRRLP